MNTRLVCFFAKSTRTQRCPCRVPALALLAIAAAWFEPAAGWAQTFEVLTPELFEVGNLWEFETEAGSQNATTTFQTLREEQVGSFNTVVFRESAPGVVSDLNVFLDNAAMTIVGIRQTQFTSPTREITATFSDPLEKIPHFVLSIDRVRLFGRGVWFSQDASNPANSGTRTQDQRVTFLGTENLEVPAFPTGISTFHIQIDESWTRTTGESGTAQRQYWLNPNFGFIAMQHAIQDRDRNGAPLPEVTVSQRLTRFVSDLPDVIVDDGSFTSTTVKAGDPVTVTWTEVSLVLDKTTTHVSNVYLSTDAVLDTSDTLLAANTPIPPLQANETNEAEVEAQVPADLPGGGYRVIVLVDAQDDIEELNENNEFVLKDILTVTGLPDLTVSSGSFAPTMLANGDDLFVTATITNRGGETAPPVWVHVGLSADDSLAADDVLLVTDIRTMETGPGISVSYGESAAIPETVPRGTYFVLVVVDALGEIDESDETNNVGILPGKVVVFRRTRSRYWHLYR